MTNKESHRLLTIYFAQQRRFKPSVHVTTKRYVKNAAKGIGVVMKSSRIMNDVPLEKVFIQR